MTCLGHWIHGHPDTVHYSYAPLSLRPVREGGVGMPPPRLRVCRHKRCPVLTPSPLCPIHAAEQERYRGSRHERGYGADHVARRQAMLDHLMPGTPCPVCGLGMWADQALDAGHSEDLRDNPHAHADRLEHSACNRGWRKGQGSVST